MISPDNIPVNMYKDIINRVLKDCENYKNYENFYFLLKTNGKINDDNDMYSLSKLNFRDEQILITKKDNGKNEKEKNENKHENQLERKENVFSFFFNDVKTKKKMNQNSLKEDELIHKLNATNINISDEQLVEQICTLLNCKTQEFQQKGKNGNAKSLHNYNSFYDVTFSTNFYLKQDENVCCDFYISNQLNNLTVISLGKYSKIIIELVHYIKEITKTKNQNIKTAIKENVKIQYDERLLKANTSGKKKRNTICINYNMNILQISFDNKIYKIKSAVQGLLCDINEQLVNDPSLLLSDTQKEGWVIVLKNKNSTTFDPTHIYTVQQYEEENQHLQEKLNIFIGQFN